MNKKKPSRPRTKGKDKKPRTANGLEVMHSPESREKAEESRAKTMSERVPGKKEAFLEDFNRNGGVIYLACDFAQIARSTYYKWMEEDKEFAAKVNEIEESKIDFAESYLMQRIKGVKVRDFKNGEEVVYDLPPDVKACLGYLQMKGKHRGFTIRQEITGLNGGPLASAPRLADDVTPEEAQRAYLDMAKG